MLRKDDSADVIVNKEDGNVGNVVNEDNPVQVWPSQVVEVHTVDKVRQPEDTATLRQRHGPR